MFYLQRESQIVAEKAAPLKPAQGKQARFRQKNAWHAMPTNTDAARKSRAAAALSG